MSIETGPNINVLPPIALHSKNPSVK